MAVTRSVLLKLEVRPAGKACNCKHSSRHRIAKGDLRLVVRDPGPASGEKGYCGPCGTAMLIAARESLNEHLAALDHEA